MKPPGAGEKICHTQGVFQSASVEMIHNASRSLDPLNLEKRRWVGILFKELY